MVRLVGWTAAGSWATSLRGVVHEAMRLGQRDAAEYAKLADVEGTRVPAGRHFELLELVSLFAACTAATPSGGRDAALLAVLRVADLRRAKLVALVLRSAACWRNGRRDSYVGPVESP